MMLSLYYMQFCPAMDIRTSRYDYNIVITSHRYHRFGTEFIRLEQYSVSYLY